MRRRWDTDERGHGVGEARASLPAIQELAELADSKEWVAEDPEAHLLPGLRDRIEISGLSLEGTEVEADGTFRVTLGSPAMESRREVRQSVWAIIGGAAELTTLVRETADGRSIVFEVVTGMPRDSHFATHGHTLRIEVVLPE